MLSDMKRKLESAFTENQVAILTEVLGEHRAGLATSVDMQDLKDVVKRLAIAQARTEERMDRVEVAIEKLTAAQARTEERMDRVEAAIEKLTAAQARTEERLAHVEKRLDRVEKRLDRVEKRLDRVEAAIEKLTAAQARTEERLAHVEKRLDRVEAAIEKLTAAQVQTEKTLNNLIRAHRETRRQLGGLSMTVGYTLENAAYRALPALLKTDYGIEVQGQLIRTYLTDNKGRSLEVNIYGKGRENGRDVVILGESKSQLSANHIDQFINRRLKHLRPQFENVLPVLVTHMTSSEPVATYAKKHGIALYYSYQF